MPKTSRQLRDDALRIWNAAVEAVRSDVLVRGAVQVEGSRLSFRNSLHEVVYDLDTIGRICVVGAGKAGAGMAAGFEAALGPTWLERKQVAGWINVPSDCVRKLDRIHLHAARPAGRNEPTAEGVAGAEETLRQVASLNENDLCVCLISGGGSALLPAPVEGISLADKLAVTLHLSGAGANIAELNTVRKHLSRIKGGGLWRACRAGNLVTLVISDVIGDPLDIIASGPTVRDTSTPAEALAVLEKYQAREAGISAAVFEHLRRAASQSPPHYHSESINLVIGNNALAVDAAGVEAERLGYSFVMDAARHLEGPAEEIGRHLASMALSMRSQSGPDCLITGGEPVVKLIESGRRGKGGRNQQLALAALEKLGDATGIALVAGGTDGEDGPTDAAGAFVDSEVIASARRLGLVPADFLARNDAYRFFEPLDALIKTGPTHTNVCDVRVVVVEQTK
jgi:glycerate 2-kinase